MIIIVYEFRLVYRITDCFWVVLAKMMDGSNDSLSILTAPVNGSAAVLLTPGRTRNIAQDMEALRLSRQDNPFIQQVIKASRESLIESHIDECESDDTILMSQDFGSTALDFVEDDALTLKEVHEHMIRSPPPTSCWSNGVCRHRVAVPAALPRGAAAALALRLAPQPRSGPLRETPLSAWRKPPP